MSVDARQNLSSSHRNCRKPSVIGMARLKRLSTNKTGTEPDNHFSVELAWIAKSDGADGRVPPSAQEGEQICLGLKCHPRSLMRHSDTRPSEISIC